MVLYYIHTFAIMSTLFCSQETNLNVGIVVEGTIWHVVWARVLFRRNHHNVLIRHYMHFLIVMLFIVIKILQFKVTVGVKIGIWSIISGLSLENIFRTDQSEKFNIRASIYETFLFLTYGEKVEFLLLLFLKWEEYYHHIV